MPAETFGVLVGLAIIKTLDGGSGDTLRFTGLFKNYTLMGV